MRKSYSKIRHIQEANLKLEQNLLNEQNPALAGFGAKVKTGFNNLFAKKSEKLSPKVAAAQARVEAKTKIVQKEIREFIQELKTLYGDKRSELTDIITKREGKANIEVIKQQLADADTQYNALYDKLVQLDKDLDVLLGNTVTAA
jgi:hypothetical protein